MGMQPRLSDGPEAAINLLEDWITTEDPERVRAREAQNKDKPCHWDAEQWAAWQAKEDDEA